MTHAPWSEDQVASLNAYQAARTMHPFTGSTADGKKVDLIATSAGWIAEHGGPIVQDWAHGWMANWGWKRP